MSRTAGESLAGRMTHRALLGLPALLVLALLGPLGPGLALPEPSHAQPAAPDVCSGLDSGKIDTTGDPLSVTVTAPPGLRINRYCVKAGSVASGGGTVYITVDPPQRTVTITHPSGKAVSHWSAQYVSCDTTPSASPGEPGTTAESTPTESAPTESAPTESAPTESAPTESAPTESAPTEPTPTESTPTGPGATGTSTTGSAGSTASPAGPTGSPAPTVAGGQQTTLPPPQDGGAAGQQSPGSGPRICDVDAGLPGVAAASPRGEDDGVGWGVAGAALLAVACWLARTTARRRRRAPARSS